MPKSARIALVYALAALSVRAPALLFVELNWDEALYWHIAREMVDGYLPYTQTWDRKPPGLFMLLAALQVLAGEQIVTLRVGTTAAVVGSALALRAISLRLLPVLPGAATLSGLIYIAGSMRSSGNATNAELLLAPFALASMALALAAAQAMDGKTWRSAMAGVLGGAALLIKPVALAEGLTTLLLLLLPGLRSDARSANAWLRLLAPMAAGLLLPLALVAVWYQLAGHLSLLTTVLTAAGEAGQAGFNAEGLLAGVREYALPAVGALAAFVMLAAHRMLRRFIPALAIWIGVVAAMLLVLGRFADHMMIQVLPPLALASAAGAAVAIQRLQVAAWRHAAFGAVLLLVFGWGAAAAVAGGVETLWRRQMAGAQDWGDRTATLAAVMRGRIETPGDLFVASRMLGLYRETGTLPPTRFPFVGHLWAGYAPVDGLAEITRIMATRPRFVVVDELWLPGGPRGDAGQARVLDRLREALARDYLAEGRTGRFISWRGGFVGGGVGATVFRRRDVPPWRPIGNGLLYDPLPLSLAAP